MVRFLDNERSGPSIPRPTTRREPTPFHFGGGGSPLLAAGSTSSNHGFIEVHMPFVDMTPSRCFAYAYVEPARVDPGLFIRLALERHGGDPPFSLAASYRGTMNVQALRFVLNVVY